MHMVGHNGCSFRGLNQAYKHLKIGNSGIL
jgi:hypothetical protein